MKSPGKIKIVVYLLGLAGVGLFIGLLIREGASRVGTAFAAAGWYLLAVVAFHFLVPLFLDAIAWRILFPRANRLPLRTLYWMRWIGESVSTLVPSAGVGGDFVRARLASQKGIPLAISAGTVLIDLTLGVFTQALFAFVGLVLLMRATGQRSFVGPTLIGAITGVLAVAGFYFVQRLGMFRLLALIVSRLASSAEWKSLVESGDKLDQTVRLLYARGRGVFSCFVLTIASVVAGSGEIWIALYALNLPTSFLHAVILQSMVLTIRSAAFAVPSGIGVQEGGYLVVGNFLGIPGEMAFALSLIARVRELAFGIPGLVAWPLVEGRRMWRARETATR